MASAGIDASIADGKFILLPRVSFSAARELRRALRKKFSVKNLGVLITDSRTLPLRAGIGGVAVGYAGFKGIKEYRSARDIFGRKFVFSRVDVADSLAAAAVLVMGEGNECKPLAVVEDAPVEFSERVRRNELTISVKDDLYRPIYLLK